MENECKLDITLTMPIDLSICPPPYHTEYGDVVYGSNDRELLGVSGGNTVAEDARLALFVCEALNSYCAHKGLIPQGDE